MPTTYDIIGCGAVVQQLHLPVLRRLQSTGEIEVAGCFDPSVDNARLVSEVLGCETWGSGRDPIPGDGVDAALIAAPPDAHAAVARRYIEAGKSVFVEKPFTTRHPEAEALVREARERQVAISVNHFWRFYPSFEVARQIVAERTLGKVHAVEATEGFRLGWAPASNYLTEDPFGGVLHDTGSHALDAVLFVLGLDRASQDISFEVDQVEKRPATEPSHDVRASAVITTDWDERIQLTLNVSRLRPHARALKVRGTFGLLVVPVTFAMAPLLFVDGNELRPEAVGLSQAASVEECFLRAHREFLGAARGEAESRLNGERFLRLSGALEDLWRANG